MVMIISRFPNIPAPCVLKLWMSLGSPLSTHLIFVGGFCRRFLRARQFDVRKALEFFWVACQARKDSSVFDFYENVDVMEYEKSRELVCSVHLPEWNSRSMTPSRCLAWTGRRDKLAYPSAFPI